MIHVHWIISIISQLWKASLFRISFQNKVKNGILIILIFFLKGEVGQQGSPGPTLLVQPPDSGLYKGEKVILNSYDTLIADIFWTRSHASEELSTYVPHCLHPKPSPIGTIISSTIQSWKKEAWEGLPVFSSIPSCWVADLAWAANGDMSSRI